MTEDAEMEGIDKISDYDYTEEDLKGALEEEGFDEKDEEET